MKGLHVGTSGWIYEHWKGVFYPDEVKSAQYLEYYAEHFDCVELNASFYHLPAHKTVLGWKHRTPCSFSLCPKVSRFITHQKKLHDVEEPFRRFMKRFESLKAKIGPVLIQLPEQVTFDNPHVGAFIKLVKRFWSWQFALEARHPSWMTEEAAAFLSHNGIIWVIADSGGKYPSKEAVTADTVYLRFHGPQGLYASNYDEKALARYARQAKQWLSEGRAVWAFFNNDSKGYAVQNARTFRDLMD